MSYPTSPQVSILTPVYNGAAHLRECIESVLAQTYVNFEYLILDNRSTDETRAIAEEYAGKDPRIRVETNATFVGAMANHNLGLQRLSPASKYIKIVHADDWLLPECVERMVAVAEEYPTVGLVSAYRLSGERVTLDRLPYPSTFVTGREIGRASLLEQIVVFGSPTSTLLRADVVRSLHPFYNEHNRHADTEACYRILQHSDFGFVHQVLTFTRRHPGSETNAHSQLFTYCAARILELHRYGPHFLSASELAAAREWYYYRYYSILGRHYFRRHGEAFRDYHRTEWARSGFVVSWTRLLTATVLEGAWLLLDVRRLLQVVQKELGLRVTGHRRTSIVGGTFKPAVKSLKNA